MEWPSLATLVEHRQKKPEKSPKDHCAVHVSNCQKILSDPGVVV
jgi:hypothetical protein